MDEYKWTAGGHEYRVGRPVSLGPGGKIVIQWRSLLGPVWETVSEDEVIANELLKLARDAGKAGRKS